MKIWGRVTWDSFFMCREERLMHQWGKMSWFKVEETKKGRGRFKITLVEL